LSNLLIPSLAVPELPTTIDALWDALLQLRQRVSAAEGRRGVYAAPLGRDRRLVVATTGESVSPAFDGDAIFIAERAVGVTVGCAGPLTGEQVALASTYLSACLAPVWASELGRAVTVGHVAQTVDGKIATSTGDSKWIGGIGNQTHAHRMRALCDAVLIGSRTLMTDAPKLNVRHVCGPDPIRVVIGTDVDARALRDSAPSPVLIVGSVAADAGEFDVLQVERECTGRFGMRRVLEALYERGITSVYVEGGAMTIERFLDEGVLDVLQIHIAPIIVGDGRAAFPRPSVSRIADAQRLHGAKFVTVDDGVMLVASGIEVAGAGSTTDADRADRTARALWHDAGGRSTLHTSPLRRPRSGWCEIETHYSAVSPGTEQLVASGRVPDDMQAAMRCAYMDGHFSFPVKYGYSLTGVVVDGPEDVVGRSVHVFHPHQDRATVRVADLHMVPENVPLSRATLAPNLETALNAVWDSEVTIGHRVLVVGFGVVGSFIARLLSQMPGVDVQIADVDPAKREFAGQMGFSVASPEVAPGSYDLSFHASASSGGLQSALDAVGYEGRVIDVSWYGAKPVNISLGGAFHHQRKRIESSQVGSVASRMRAGWTHARRMELVMRLLGDPVYDAHITRTVDFAALPQLFAESAPSLSILVKY
jgi:riboflavin-specific deaminase-like protein